MHPLLCTISRVAENQWHAVENDLVVGRGYASRRLDGRTFVSIDTWRDDVFDRLADAMVADQATPLYTVVDETDRELTVGWERAGFTTWRREREVVVPTGPASTPIPAGVIITAADEEPLRELEQAIRAELDWQTMPAEVLPWQGGTTPLDPSKYTVAKRNNQYVGLLRLATYTRQPRIGLIAVRADERRQGIARALLSQVLGDLRHVGVETVAAEINETNHAAIELFESFAARRTGSNLELVHGKD
ncbi:GNAT family N-acetyltransferase [Kribbella antibiotica]|uniref:GNAT family N-acetyltransferase n=1 Tax=Kribbella antibiotica TaxID=190195 RepID=A0A4R4YPZ1_9ACTN|nr:GNAT family N-acetyltransferase [Kribbella antibiotica]TDD46209.1 GNAT family N-acetyltransferase [Kribbella antibiotica]